MRLAPITLAAVIATGGVAGCAGIGQRPGDDAGSTGGAGGGAGSTATGGVGGAAGSTGGSLIPIFDAGPPCTDAAACAARCGDGKLDPALGEACDDGNTRGGDG